MKIKDSPNLPVFYSGRTLGAVLLCLFFLTFQVLLPIVHAVHENSEELPPPLDSRNGMHVSEIVAPVGINPFLGMNPDHHHHDPDSCPICQAILLAHNFCVSAVSTGSMVPEPVDLIVPDYSLENIPSFFSFDSNPRSPPHCPVV